MAIVLATMVAVVGGISALQTPSKGAASRFLPDRTTEPSRYAYEMFVMIYTPIWIFVFGIVVVFQLYEDFDAWMYIKFCGGMMMPLLLQPIVYPSAGFDSPDQARPLLERYSFKANLWILVYSFIGNYWYTHSSLRSLIDRCNPLPLLFAPRCNASHEYYANRLLLSPQGVVFHAKPSIEQRPDSHDLRHPLLLLHLPLLF